MKHTKSILSLALVLFWDLLAFLRLARLSLPGKGLEFMTHSTGVLTAAQRRNLLHEIAPSFYF